MWYGHTVKMDWGEISEEYGKRKWWVINGMEDRGVNELMV